MAVKRRKFIRTVSYLIAVCVVFAVAGNFSRSAKASYEDTLEKVRFEGLNSLCEYMHELSGGLSLLAVSSGESVADSSYYVSARAVGALGSAGCFNSEKTVNISRFLKTVYDFSQSFSGDDIARETAAKFSDYAEEVYYHLSDITAAILGGAYSLSEYGSPYARNKQPYFENYLDYSNGSEDEIFALAASAQATVSNCEILNGKETISAEKAKQKASEIIGIDAVLWRENVNKSENSFEVYSFAHGDTAIDICKSGGVLCRVISPRPSAERIYSYDDALLKAEDFLSRYGYKNMKVMGSETGEFTACFLFVPEINGVLLMNASVQIEVCLSSGGISFFDASDYIKNFRYDVYSTDEIPDISGVLPSNLALENVFVCFEEINGREQVCYLAVCRYGSDEVYVYIDRFSLKVKKTLLKNTLPN